MVGFIGTPYRRSKVPPRAMSTHEAVMSQRIPVSISRYWHEIYALMATKMYRLQIWFHVSNGNN